MDTTAMKIVSDEEWVKARKALLRKDSSHPDSDEDADIILYMTGLTLSYGNCC
jgi:hypothetical protein